MANSSRTMRMAASTSTALWQTDFCVMPKEPSVELGLTKHGYTRDGMRAGKSESFHKKWHEGTGILSAAAI